MTKALSFAGIAFISIIALVLSAQLASANHKWGKYHWERSENPLQLALGDNVSGVWDASLILASDDWNISTVLDTSVVPGTTNGTDCDPTAGRVEVCNAEYGNNGWLGIAQIWASRKGSHITQGLVKLNDTYYNSAPYNTDAWRNLVMCQEVGHTLGLGHQDENFNNANLDTCMDYTSNPESNQHPNDHDYEQLESIYAHLDGSGGGKPGGGGGKGRGNRGDAQEHVRLDNPSEWGMIMSEDAQGKPALYARNVGNDEVVFTFVTWVDGHHDDEHTQ